MTKAWTKPKHEIGRTPAAISHYRPSPTVNDIVRQHRGVSADMALRLAVAFDTTAQFWLNLQAAYDLRKAETERGRRSGER